jgi:hypothetical protein
MADRPTKVQSGPDLPSPFQHSSVLKRTRAAGARSLSCGKLRTDIIFFESRNEKSPPVPNGAR